MKNKLIIVLTLLVAAAGSSCNKDFLDRKPLTTIGDGTFFNTTTDLQVYVNKYYPDLGPTATNYFYTGFYNAADQGTDDVLESAFSSQYAGTRIVPPSGGWNYKLIRDLNYFFANYQKAVGAKSEIDTYVGEASFFRAWYFFKNVKDFGDVPLVKEVIPASYEVASKIPRSPRNEVVDFILADLDEAIAKLPVKASAVRGRLNKEAALLFKSRVALYEGTWEKYHQNDVFGVKGSDGTKYLQQARDAAKQLIDMKTVSLYGNTVDDYSKMFYTKDLAGISEVILWKDFSRSEGIENKMQYYIKLGGNSGFTRALQESFLCLDGRPVFYNGGTKNPGYKGDLVIKNIPDNRDPRLDAVWSKPGDILAQGTPPAIYIKPALELPNEERDITGYQIRKGLDPSITFADTRSYENGSIIFRYAEALLNYAEALAELGEISQADLDLTVNALRKRSSTADGKRVANLTLAGLSVVDDNAEYSWGSSKIVNEIRRERRVELSFEGFRSDDLKRWAIAHKIFNNGYRPKGIHYIGSSTQNWFKANKPDFDANTIANNGKGSYLDEKGYIDPYKGQIPAGYAFDKNRDYLTPLSYNETSLGGYPQNPGWK